MSRSLLVRWFASQAFRAVVSLHSSTIRCIQYSTNISIEHSAILCHIERFKAWRISIKWSASINRLLVEPRVLIQLLIHRYSMTFANYLRHCPSRNCVITKTDASRSTLVVDDAKRVKALAFRWLKWAYCPMLWWSVQRVKANATIAKRSKCVSRANPLATCSRWP